MLQGWEDVGVGVEGDADGGVSEAFGDDFGVDALAEHQGGVGVAEVVEAHRWQPLAAQTARPSGRQCVWVGRPAVAAIDDETVFFPIGEKMFSSACLFLLLVLQVEVEEGGQVHGAA